MRASQLHNIDTDKSEREEFIKSVIYQNTPRGYHILKRDIRKFQSDKYACFDYEIEFMQKIIDLYDKDEGGLISCKRILMIDAQPDKYDIFEPGTIAICNQYDQLTAYWTNGRNTITKSVAREHATDILDSLPESNEESTDENLINNVTSIFSYKTRRSLKECMLQAIDIYPHGFRKVCKIFGEDRFIFDILSNRITHELTQGPRIKNGATFELEKLIHALLNNKNKIQCSFNALNEIEIRVKGKLFNLTHILENEPDFQQIHLTSEDLDHYAEFIDRPLHHAKRIRSEPHQDEIDSQNRPLITQPPIHHSEELAIKLYTTDYYKKIQSFLRSDYKNGKMYGWFGLNLKEVPQILLCASIATHRNNQIHMKKVEKKSNLSFRREHLLASTDFFKNRMDSLMQGKPIREKAFISTSESDKGFLPGVTSFNLKSVFHEPISPNPIGNNIHSFSNSPDEYEVLYGVGTQVQYTDYMNYKGQHFFSVRPIRSLDGIKNDGFVPSYFAWHELKVIDKMLENFLKENKHSTFRKLFDTVSNETKLSHLRLVKENITAVLEGTESPEKLTQITLNECRHAIQTAIENNIALVESAILPASLGNSDVILQSVLSRIDDCIERFENESLMPKNKI